MPKVYNKKNKDIPNDAVYVGRPTEWRNPYVIGMDGDRRQVVASYARWFSSRPDLIERAKKELRGKDLVCWCAPPADVLFEIANG